MSLLFSAWTVLVALVFLGIVIYVFMEKKAHFDEAARIPLEEDDEPLAERGDEQDDPTDPAPVTRFRDPGDPVKGEEYAE